jgi:hypothetical protein
MKLFKIAIADFVKEVLKPSWRQGNMSKEAFKTIVRKTVDKVSNSVPSSHIPKTPAKMKHYVQSSQKKVTKLVMVCLLSHVSNIGYLCTYSVPVFVAFCDNIRYAMVLFMACDLFST